MDDDDEDNDDDDGGRGDEDDYDKTHINSPQDVISPI